jgi:hypothetical protein
MSRGHAGGSGLQGGIQAFVNVGSLIITKDSPQTPKNAAEGSVSVVSLYCSRSLAARNCSIALEAARARGKSSEGSPAQKLHLK